MNLRKKLYKRFHTKKHDDVEKDPFDIVPDEVILYIFAFFDISELLTLCIVSQRMNQLASHDWLWKPFIINYLDHDETAKQNQSCMTFFKKSKIEELFNLIKNEELELQYYAFLEIERKFPGYPTPLLISYVYSLNINPMSWVEFGGSSSKRNEKNAANRLLTNLPIISHSNNLILREMHKFLSRVSSGYELPAAYIHYIPDFAPFYLYTAFRKLAEQNPFEIILFKDPSFFRVLNNILALQCFRSDKVMILSDTLLEHPEMLYSPKIIPILSNMLDYLQNTDVNQDGLFDYYTKSLCTVPRLNRGHA